MGLHCIKLLTIVLVAINLSPSTALFESKQLFIGTVEPMDPDVCETQNITFTSTLLETPTVNYSIGFTIKNRSTNGTYVAVENDRIEMVNESIFQVTVNILEVADVSKSEYLYVNSYYWQDFGNKVNKLKLGNTSSARVFPLPEQVKDFECRVYNYESMVCTWNYGKNYGENMPDVTFLWRIPALSASWTNCNNLDIHERTCTWDQPKDGFFKYSNITIGLILEQKCGIKISSELDVDTTKIVKPDPVLRISATVSSSKCIQLSWDTSHVEKYNSSYFHRIVVSSKYETFTIFNTTDLKYNKNICDLHPYTKYTFTVSIKPSGKYSGYWSEAVHDVAMTNSDIPSASPQLIDGVYTFNHLKCQGTDSKRRVCVFWRPIRKEQENGPMRGIQCSFTAISDKTEQTLENWAEDNTYGCSDLMCNLSYNVIIQARNVNGTSEAGHPLNIPKYSSAILPPQFTVEWDNISNVYISWERREHSFIKGYTVAWCRNKNGKCELTQEVGLKRVLFNTSEAVLQINASAQDFLYGVSTSTETGSTWVTWQDCVYQKNGVPTREPQNVGVSTGSEDNTLLVIWDKLTCQTDQPFILLYIVRYWKINGRSQKSVNVSASGEAKVVLNNLEKDQTYSVTVRGVTKEGHEGPESRPHTGVPVNKSLNPLELAGITIGAIVCILFAGVGIFFVIRKCKKKANRVLNRVGEITIPAQPDEDLLKGNRKNSDDSGCAETRFLEDQTHTTATEQEVGHNTNGYISAETATLNLALSHRMSDLHDTKMLSVPAFKLEFENKEENTTLNTSTKDRSTEYVKGNQAFFDPDTDDGNDNQNDTSEINDNKDFCGLNFKIDIPRTEYRHQNIKNDSTNVHANFHNHCGNEICKMSSPDGEHCQPQLMKNDSYLQFRDIDLQANVLSPSGLERCKSVSSGNSNDQLLDSFHCSSDLTDVSPKPSTGHNSHQIELLPFSTEKIFEADLYLSHAIKAPVSRDITHQEDKPSPIENSVPRGVLHDIKGYVSNQVDAIVLRELSRDTDGYFSHQVDAPVSNELRHNTNRYVSGPVETSDSRRLSHDTNGYVPHPVEDLVPTQVKLESNGHLFNQIETSISREHKHETVPYQIRTPLPTGVSHEEDEHVSSPVEAPVPKEFILEINGYISNQIETSVPREHEH